MSATLFVCAVPCAQSAGILFWQALSDLDSPVLCRCNEFPRNFREGMKVM